MNVSCFHKFSIYNLEDSRLRCSSRNETGVLGKMIAHLARNSKAQLQPQCHTVGWSDNNRHSRSS